LFRKPDGGRSPTFWRTLIPPKTKIAGRSAATEDGETRRKGGGCSRCTDRSAPPPSLKPFSDLSPTMKRGNWKTFPAFPVGGFRATRCSEIERVGEITQRDADHKYNEQGKIERETNRIKFRVNSSVAFVLGKKITSKTYSKVHRGCRQAGTFVHLLYETIRCAIQDIETGKKNVISLFASLHLRLSR